jgi:hypothetical protein
MVAAVYDITIEQGATFVFSLIWRDSSGTPIDLTGCSARMQVRRKYNSETPWMSLTSDDGDITLGGAAGTIEVVGSAEVTETIPAPGCGVYDLEVVSAGGLVTRVIQGSATISPEVTRE